MGLEVIVEMLVDCECWVFLGYKMFLLLIVLIGVVISGVCDVDYVFFDFEVEVGICDLVVVFVGLYFYFDDGVMVFLGVRIGEG